VLFEKINNQMANSYQYTVLELEINQS